MEELHRIHKDVPFGWFAWLQAILARRATTDGSARRKVATPHGVSLR